MAKQPKRSKVQINADKIIKAELMKLGDIALEDAQKTTKVAANTYYKDGSLQREGGTLRDSLNYRVVKDTTLVMFQVYYGQYNTPKGKPTPYPREGPEFNALLISLNKFKDDTTKAIVTEINDTLLKNFKKK